jgi:hypothetical protein
MKASLAKPATRNDDKRQRLGHGRCLQRARLGKPAELPGIDREEHHRQVVDDAVARWMAGTNVALTAGIVVKLFLPQ